VTSKFERVPVDEDTKIISQQETNLGEYDVLYQKWYWDGIVAESFIFANEDIVGIADDDIEAVVRTSPLLKADSEITLVRLELGFTVVNFNFEADLAGQYW